MNEPTPEFVAHLTIQAIKETLNQLYDPISGFLTVRRAQFIENFSSYCTLTANRCGLVRTLYSKNKPMKLDEIYVKTRFQQGPHIFSDKDLVNKFASGERVIVRGNGGSGKTIFLKYLWLQRFEKFNGKIPILVELRRLNDLQTVDLSAFCRNELQSDMSFGSGVFEKLCEAGRFEFIFDGFDEVAKENRKTVERQIIELSEKYRSCCFLVSGREDDRFSSWGEFQIFSVAPLPLLDVRQLIEKIPFDRKVKKKFLDTLKEEFYEKHKSFLSSPLLSVMMLMTFNENAIIPRKLTEFYRSAFQTLLTWHDATKDSFERDRALSVDEFRRVFSTFCLLTYYEQAFDFDEDEFRSYIKRALGYHSLDTGVDAVLDDMCESANLLQKDGLKYAFVHRSFQEYFAAECTMHVVSGKADSFLEVFARRYRDTVFAMCYEIHPELVYDKFFQIRIQEIIDEKLLISSWINSGVNVWGCDFAWIEFSINSDFGVHGFTASYDTDDKLSSLFRTIDLCSQVTDSLLPMSPPNKIFDVLLSAVSNINSAGIFSSSLSSRMRIDLKFSQDKYEILLGNVGEGSVSKRVIDKAQSHLARIIEPDMKKVIKNSQDFYSKSLKMFLGLKSEREKKEKSIDEILGM